jgi:hypothetical protein
MKYDPFLVAPFNSGLDTDLAPWLIPGDAFTELNNAYLYHGVVSKRPGTQFFVQFEDNVGPTTNQITGIYTYEGIQSGQSVSELLFTDTKRMCRYNAVSETCDSIDTADIFASSNYTWFANFGVTGSVTQNTLYITNNDDVGVPPATPMRSYTFGSATTSDFQPKYGSAGTDLVKTCLLIFVLKNRLLLLNTVEGSSNERKPQRARWCKSGDPRTSGDAWRQDIAGNGGFVDCPTSDFIIGAAALQDYLIVFFSNSTWSLRPTPDPALPFRWDRINNYRACDATFSIIPHDRYAISFGKTGIVACDGIELKRIDEKIDNFVTDEIDQENFSTTYSGRDYSLRRSWTLYNSAGNASDDNDAVLVRNEEEGTWSTYTLALSCVGNGSAPKDFTLADFTGDYDWDFTNFTEETALSFYTQATGKLFLGGDYDGKVYILEYGGSDDDAIGDDTAITMTATTAAFNPYKDEGVEAQLGYVDFYVSQSVQGSVNVSFLVDDNPTAYTTQAINLVPELNWVADVTDVSLTNPCVIEAVSHGISDGDTVYIYGVDGANDINSGPYTVTVIDDDNFSVPVDATGFGTYTGGGIIVTSPIVAGATRVWKRAYAGGIGYLHQLKLENTGVNQAIQIHAMRFWFRKTGSRELS